MAIVSKAACYGAYVNQVIGLQDYERWLKRVVAMTVEQIELGATAKQGAQVLVGSVGHPHRGLCAVVVGIGIDIVVVGTAHHTAQIAAVNRLMASGSASGHGDASHEVRGHGFAAHSRHEQGQGT